MTTNATHHRRLTPGRMGALMAIVLVGVALGLIYDARDSDLLSVPAGARAGQLALEPCTVHGLKADCGTLVVPENRQNPRSRLIAVPVERIRARASARGAPLFRLEGGPGQSNMRFPFGARYAEHRDVVYVGYRGVDGSSRLDCPEVEDERRRSGDLLSERSTRASARAFGDCARRLREDGVDLGGYSMAERVDDFEAARHALGYDRIDLLSESAGTRTAMVYAWRHPSSIRRSVMVGVNPPGRFLYDQAATTAQLRRFSDLCARAGSCSGHSRDLAASMRRTASDMPRRWGILPIHGGNVRLASFFGLTDASEHSSPVSAPMTLDSWRAVTKGDPSGLWFQSFAASLIFPRAQVWGDTAAIGRADAAAAERHFASTRRGGSPLGDAGNRFLWAGGDMAGGWPVNADDAAYTTMRTSNVETLLVSGELDGATPPSASRGLLRHFPNGRRIVLEGFGHTTDFWNEQPSAGTRLITAFLDRGVVDASLYKAQRVDLTPGTTQAGVAKIVAGAMGALALVTVLSLLWLALRARSGRRFGPKAGAFVRSVHASVIGLGGWVLAALLAMVLVPKTPVDDELLVVLSVAVPVALAVHWASVRAEATDRTRFAGLVAAVAGAVIGAWLGFEAPGSPMGLLTAIPGAVAVANLALILRELAAVPVARPEPHVTRRAGAAGSPA